MDEKVHEPCELRRLAVGVFRAKGHVNVQARGTRGLAEAPGTDLLEHCASRQGRFHYPRERNVQRIQIENHVIRILDPIDPRVPGIDLYAAEIRHEDQSSLILAQ